MVQPPTLEDEQTKASVSSPPYISFTTLLGCLTWLKAEGVPLRFDRSFWSKKYNGSAGPQLISALRFLGLMEGEEPLPALEQLVEADEVERKRLLREILQNAYRDVVYFDQLDRATIGMLHNWMKKYNLQTSTQRKAESFLINALKHVDFPLSSVLQKAARNKPVTSVLRKPRGTGDGQKKPLQEPDRTEHQDHKHPTTTRNLTLNSGGEVTLKISVNLFDLSEEDREFVMGLVDAFRTYPADEEQDEDES